MVFHLRPLWDAVQEAVKQVAAVTFKNVVRQTWPDDITLSPVRVSGWSHGAY